jgi:D-alanyl-D-alanine carboxypeptidase/D-alanyl-D-alanine-endopeptidase (penicillin-binding protein 4)
LSLLLSLSFALAAASPAQAVDAGGLRTTLEKLQPRLGSSAGAYVVDLTTGTPLYAHREDVALVPASNEKLFVTAAALLRYGPAGTLPTTVRGTVDPDGVVLGNLFLVGGGDPTLSDTGLQALAQQVADAGVVRVTGAVVGDESLFDRLRGGPDSAFRPDGDLGGWLTALSLGHGRAGGGFPARAVATRFGKLLKAAGVAYGRRPTGGTAPAPEEGTAPLATLPSPPMRTLAATTNVASENFYAEMLTKALGASFGAVGSTAAGLAVVRSDLAQFGVHPRMTDGSGLSRANRTTARQVVRLLERMHGQEIADSWRASLPVAGRSGTIRRRMRGTAAQDRCQAKTGTLIGVSALSGYCTTAGGNEVAFSFLENRVCNWCAKRVEDRMVAAIAKLELAPPVAASGRRSTVRASG